MALEKCAAGLLGCVVLDTFPPEAEAARQATRTFQRKPRSPALYRPLGTGP